MRASRPRKFHCTLLACVVAECLTAQTVVAQRAPAAVLEEVIVSARRRQETVQNVPAAISTLTSGDLRNLQIGNFGDIAQTVPNLEAQKQFGSASSPFFIMRGVTTGTLSFQADAGIALYIDNVYIGRPAGTAFDIADIERVEVLRGPQGTLFGRNSTGGAINFVTAGPTGEWGLRAEATVGNYDQRRVKATVNFAEIAGLSARLTVLRNESDGYVDNLSAGTRTAFSAPFGTIEAADDFGNEETNALGLALRYTGVEGLSLDYKFDYTDKDSSQLAPQMLGTYGGNDVFLASLGATHVSPNRLSKVPLDLMSQTELKASGHSLTAEFEISDSLAFKGITSYREFEEDGNGNDIDGNTLNDTGLGGPGNRFAYISALQAREQDQWSQEIQLIGSHERIDWILGGFWFTEEGEDNNPVFIGVPFPAGAVYQPGETNGSSFATPDYFAGANVEIENTSKAVYGHVSWYVGADLELSAGLRYTEDDREEFVIERAAITNQKFSASGNNTDGILSATYTIAPDVQIYAKYSTGYLSGGTIGGVAFDKEIIDSYEAGLKSDWFQDRLRVNITAFHAERKDLQTLTFSPTAGTVLLNSGDSEQDGIELEIMARPAAGLTFTANYGYLDDQFETNARSFAPEHTFYGAVDYEIGSLGELGFMSFRLDGRWIADRYGLSCPAGTTTTPDGCTNLGATDPVLDDHAIMKANWQVGARLSLADIRLGERTVGRVSVWGRNLLDTDEIEFARDLGNGTVLGTFQAPRTFGVDFAIEY